MGHERVMKYETENFKEIINEYFKRLSIVVSQVPIELREILLPRYMLYRGYKSELYVDIDNKIAFEVKREKASRLSVKTLKIDYQVEKEVFGVLGRENMIEIKGTSNVTGQIVAKEVEIKGNAEIEQRIYTDFSYILTFGPGGVWILPIEPVKAGMNCATRRIRSAIIPDGNSGPNMRNTWLPAIIRIRKPGNDTHTNNRVLFIRK